MKKLFISFMLFFIFAGLSHLKAQKDVVKENFFDAEFFLSEEEYKDALYSFNKVYSAGYQENANINYRIGVCYLNIAGQKEKAIPYLEKAVKNISENYKEGNLSEVTAPADAWLFLGNAYRINYQLDKAVEAYNSYMKMGAKVSTVDAEYAKQQIESCNRAKEAIKNPSPIFKQNMGKNFNTSLNNFQTIISGDGNSMAYMTAQKFYDAAYFVKKINGNWSNPINITPQIESDGNQYVSSFSFDGSKLFLVRITNFDGDIMLSEYAGGRWNPSKPIGKPVNTKFFESHACISPDGKTLYFTSNRTGGVGGMDIYKSNISEKGEWSEPENLGNVVNTPLNEETPFISADGKTLYFSSQGHTTIGGYDVFTSELQANNTWAEPKPLPYPVNSTDDELFYFPSPQNDGGYLTLYQADGFGEGDLYFIKTLSPEEAQTTALKPAVTEAEKAPAVAEKPVVTEPVAIPVAEPVKPTEPSVKYLIKPVFFGFDSFVLTDASKEKLNDVVKALNSYPNLRLEVRGYTDSKGSFEYNQMLSDKRALAVTNYLTAQGIPAERLKKSGLSESENVAINSFPDGSDALEGRKLNRRVEFRIVELGGALLIIEEIPVPEQLKVK